MKGESWFAIGLALLAAIMGFLVGASHSPVAGVTITAAFGLAIPIFNVLNNKPAPVTAASEGQPIPAPGATQTTSALGPKELATIGKILTVFCVMFVLGLSLGAYSRVQDWPHVQLPPQQFPWKDTTQMPKESRYALDWIVVRARLHGMGYTDQQIQSLYSALKGAEIPQILMYAPPTLSSVFIYSPEKQSIGGAVAYTDTTAKNESKD